MFSRRKQNRKTAKCRIFFITVPPKPVRFPIVLGRLSVFDILKFHYTQTCLKESPKWNSGRHQRRNDLMEKTAEHSTSFHFPFTNQPTNQPTSGQSTVGGGGSKTFSTPFSRGTGRQGNPSYCSHQLKAGKW